MPDRALLRVPRRGRDRGRQVLRLWTSSRIGEARIQEGRQTLLQISSFLLKELSLMGSDRIKLEEAREVAGLFDQMVRCVSERTVQ
jgi:hypothetical protein